MKYILATLFACFSLNAEIVHTLFAVHENGKYVELEGSLVWEINEQDRPKATEWEEKDPLHVYFSDKSWEIENISKGHTLSGALSCYNDQMLNEISSIRNHNTQIELNDGKLFQTSSLSSIHLNHFQEGDLVFWFHTKGNGYALWNFTRETKIQHLKHIPPVPIPQVDSETFDLKEISGLEKRLNQQIWCQSEAIKSICETLTLFSLGLNDDQKPLGRFLLLGPNGGSKKELAEVLAKELLKSETKMIHLNMADYADGFYFMKKELADTLSTALNALPSRIIFLEGIENAHRDIQAIIASLLEKGVFFNSQNEQIDCTKCLFLLSSEIGIPDILKMNGKSSHEMLGKIEPKLMKQLTPSLLSQVEPLFFYPFSKKDLKGWVDRELRLVIDDFAKKKQIALTIDPTVNLYLENLGSSAEFDITHIRGLIEKKILGYLYKVMGSQGIAQGGPLSIAYQNGEWTVNQVIFFDRKPEEETEEKFSLDHVLDLEQRLNQCIVGQPEAVSTVSEVILRYAAKINDPKRPLGVLLFVGPTGVGKTELSKALAIELLGSDTHLVRLNMADFEHSSSLTRLIGSPPGYVNHEEGGQLTEAIKNNPNSIVLLDEFEKAAPEIMKAFLPIFDEGFILDAKNIQVDCSKCLFILTSNLSSQLIQTLSQNGFSTDEILGQIQSQLIKALSPEVYNRVEPVVFHALSEECLFDLIQLMLTRVEKNLYKQKALTLTIHPTVIEYLIKNGYSKELGARPLKTLIEKKVIGAISKAIIREKIPNGAHLVLSYEDTTWIVDWKLK